MGWSLGVGTHKIDRLAGYDWGSVSALLCGCLHKTETTLEASPDPDATIEARRKRVSIENGDVHCDGCSFWGADGENEDPLTGGPAFYRKCTNPTLSMGVPSGTRVSGDYFCPGWVNKGQEQC